MKTRDWLLLFSLIIALTQSVTAQATPHYRLTMLPLALNTFDEVDYTECGGGISGTRVIGDMTIYAGRLSDQRAALWQVGHPVHLLDTTPVTPHDPNSSLYASLTATALNRRGDVVGYSHYHFTGAWSSQSGTAWFLLSGKSAKLSGYYPTAGAADLSGFPQDTDSVALGINDHGDIVGNIIRNTHSPLADDAPLPASVAGTHAFLRRGSRVQVLWPGVVRGLNNHGQIVGVWDPNSDPSASQNRGVLWRNGHLTFLKMQPMAINERGEIAGNMPLTDDAGKACVWKHGHVTLLSRQISRTYALNNRGEIVGETQTSVALHRTHATVWWHGHSYDLNHRVNLPGNWVLETAIGINEAGWIIGTGYVYRAAHDIRPLRSFTFLLTPSQRGH